MRKPHLRGRGPHFPILDTIEQYPSEPGYVVFTMPSPKRLMSQSYAYRAPVAPFVLKALGCSVKLGAVAFVLVVPLGIAAGVVAALQAGRAIDRIISLVGLSATVLPEFVTGIVLVLIFGVWLKLLPITATWPADAGVLTQIHYLLLPSLPLVLALFGYLA